MNKKYIVRECEQPEIDFYFDCDGWDDIYIFHPGRYGYTEYGVNSKEYEDVKNDVYNLFDAFDDVGNKLYYDTFKEAMESVGIVYNSTKCHSLKNLWKVWNETGYEIDEETVASYLSVVSGDKWETACSTGYCQDDYCYIIYNTKRYTEKDVEIYGDMFNGCCKEFCVIELDEDENETDSCYGYYVANCQAWNDEEYKKIVCEWAGIDEEETTLEMIDDWKTQTVYTYRAV